MLGVIIAVTGVFDQLTAAAYLIEASAQEVNTRCVGSSKELNTGSQITASIGA
jgi:hypothetical protein